MRVTIILLCVASLAARGCAKRDKRTLKIDEMSKFDCMVRPLIKPFLELLFAPPADFFLPQRHCLRTNRDTYDVEKKTRYQFCKWDNFRDPQIWMYEKVTPCVNALCDWSKKAELEEGALFLRAGYLETDDLC